MRPKLLFVVGSGFIGFMACAVASRAEERKLARTTASSVADQKTAHYRKRATRVRGYFAMRGGYAYGRSDVTATNGRWRTPYGVVDQSPGGPFDSGFFFDSGITTLNNAPYPK